MRRLVHWLAILGLHATLAAPLLLWRWARGQRRQCLHELGIRLAAAAEHLGGAAIKVAQIASVRADLFPADALAGLSRLQDRAALFGTESADALARAHADASTALAHVEQQPIAAGSVAAVLRGRTVAGAPVAIKVVSAEAERQWTADVRILGTILHLVCAAGLLPGMPVREAFVVVAGCLLAQFDLEREARAMVAFRAALGREVVVPVPHVDLCGRRVLVMDLHDGGHKITDPCLPQAAYEKACRVLLRAVFTMIFTTGRVHLDLHPGNVRVDARGRVTLFDFGLFGTVDPLARTQFLRLMLALASGDVEAGCRSLIDSATVVPDDLDSIRLGEDMRNLLARHTGRSAGDFLVAGFVRDLFALQRRHGLQAGPGFVTAVWALAMFEGLVRHRFPHLDFQAELKPYALADLIDQARRRQWG